LIKSGKVSAGAHLISADAVEASAEAEKGGDVSAPANKASHDQVPEDILRVRIHELETMVTDQRERLAKLANADAIETVQHERDVLSSLVKELETQRDAILRNAEKDSRAFERKTELLRQQIRKLEQQLEEANGRLLTDAEAAALKTVSPADDEQKNMLEQLRREADVLRGKLLDSERQLEDVRKGAAASQASFGEEREALKTSVSALEQAVLFHEKQHDETRQILSVRETELAEAKRCVAEGEQRLVVLRDELDKAGRKVREGEAAFAELLSDANTRDTEYAEKIAALEKACAQSPEETARFYSDQAAVFELVKTEVEELSKTMELERSHVEQMKEWSAQRQQALTERKQTLLRQLGGSPAEMTRRTLREQPSDPNAARLRTELDELRMLHDRAVRLAADRERDLQRKLRVLEAESTKLQGQAVEAEKTGLRMQDLSEQLRKREQELADERKNREAERVQFQGSQQALLMRIEELEKKSRPTTPDEVQSAEARNVKIATWMRLKK
jgi:hypothetical protein